MTMPYAHGDAPLIPRPELTLPALRQAVATVGPSRLPEFFEDLQRAFVRAGDENSVVPIRMFYRQWGVVVEIERHPETARRLHAAEQAVSDPDPAVRERAIREAGEIVRAAHREVAGESFQDDLLDGLPDATRAETELRRASEREVKGPGRSEPDRARLES
jgi:hypothetical protein